MKYLLPALLLLASCISPPPGPRRIDIVLRNTTPYPVEIRAKAGAFGRTIRLEPGATWNGWVPPFVPVQAIDIEVAEPRAASRPRLETNRE